MNILVAIKSVPDYSVAPRIKRDGSGTDMQSAKQVMNPFDEIAVEEALRIKEAGLATEVIVITIGTKNTDEIIRAAFAMGVEVGFRVDTDDSVEPLLCAKVLAYFAIQENIELCLLGKQAVDTDNNQTGQMLGGILGWSQATFASKVVVNKLGFEVTREIDGGLETIQISKPAIVTSDLRLNEPRYLTLPNIVRAKRKEITVISLDSLQLNYKKRLTTLKVELPVKNRANKQVKTVDELVATLHEDKVL